MTRVIILKPFPQNYKRIKLMNKALNPYKTKFRILIFTISTLFIYLTI